MTAVLNEKLDAKTYYLDKFAQAQKNLPGAQLSWLNALRRNAITDFEFAGFPTRKQEAWKYTSVHEITKHPLPINLGEEQSNDAFIDENKLSYDAYELTFIDGNFSKNHSDLQGLPKNIVITNLQAALNSHPDLVKKYLNHSIAEKKQTFASLNTAFLHAGAFIFIPEGVVLDKPIHINSVMQTAEQLNHFRHLIVLEKNAQATVIETFQGENNKNYFNNVITEMSLAEGAQCFHYKLQNEGDKATHISKLYVSQAKNTVMNSTLFSFGAQLGRSDTQVLLTDERAECGLAGLYVGSDKQHLVHYTDVRHEKPHCTSDELYKGILDEKAHGVFNGRVLVAKDAQGTAAGQTNNNLLLSKEAEIDTKPQLEIFADDVRCRHGATVGQLDDDALFYLCSRGIGAKDARQLLIQAFAAEVMDKIKLKSVRETINGLLQSKIRG